MTDLVAQLAVIGRVVNLPGAVPVILPDPEVECIVRHDLQDKLSFPEFGIEVNTTDCTVFTVTHKNQGETDLERVDNALMILERSVEAVSDIAIWMKILDRSSAMSPFMRQIGVVDVKAFFIVPTGDHLVGWQNPQFQLSRGAASMLTKLVSGGFPASDPTTDPIPEVARRVYSSLDLINLGFHTESFINLFSLVDDLVQQVVKNGLAKKGLNKNEQKAITRAIRDDRLKHYVCSLTKLCDWESLEDSNGDLFKELMKVNTLRNDIMHGRTRLNKHRSVEASNTLLDVINWLRSNPFGLDIPTFSLKNIALPRLFRIPRQNSD